jgi:hypothetical protein
MLLLQVCFGFFLMLGTVGWRASLMFVRRIYQVSCTVFIGSQHVGALLLCHLQLHGYCWSVASMLRLCSRQHASRTVCVTICRLVACSSVYCAAALYTVRGIVGVPF